MTFIETSNLSGITIAIRQGSTPWSVERELTVRKLWSDGYTASQIALNLGETTRNAVIGKLHRMGLTMNHRTPGVSIKCDPTARMPGSKIGRRPDGYRRNPLPKGTVAPIHEPLPLIAAIERSDAACSFPELAEGMCRYPYGEPREADFAFCGRHADGTYCAGHHAIAYRRPI